MTLAQEKVIETIFCEPIQDNVWDRLHNNDLNDNDFLWIQYENLQIEDLIQIANHLEKQYMFMYDEGYCAGVKYSE